jgi:hypothetical protein
MHATARSLLFLGLLAGCGSASKPADSADSSCPNNTFENDIEVPQSEVDAVTSPDGTLPLPFCSSVCEPTMGGDLEDCIFVGPAPVETESIGTTSVDPGSTGLGDGTAGGGTAGGGPSDGTATGTTGADGTAIVRCVYVDDCMVQETSG